MGEGARADVAGSSNWKMNERRRISRITRKCHRWWKNSIASSITTCTKRWKTSWWLLFCVHSALENFSHFGFRYHKLNIRQI